MIRKIIVLAAIVMILMTFRSESAFDLNSGRMRLKFSLLGLTFYDQIKETPLSQLKTEFFPAAAEEPNWYPIGGKTDVKQPGQAIPVDAILQVASLLKNDAVSPDQKKAILAQVWDSLKNQNYEAIGQLKTKLDSQIQAQ